MKARAWKNVRINAAPPRAVRDGAGAEVRSPFVLGEITQAPRPWNIKEPSSFFFLTPFALPLARGNSKHKLGRCYIKTKVGSEICRGHLPPLLDFWGSVDDANDKLVALVFSPSALVFLETEFLWENNCHYYEDYYFCALNLFSQKMQVHHVHRAFVCRINNYIWVPAGYMHAIGNVISN